MGKSILVVSISAWNQRSCSDTFPSLLNNFNPTDIANIHIRDGAPDSSVASRYFMINEMAVMRSVLRRKILTGHEVKAGNCTEPSTSAEISIYHHRHWLLLVLREIGWKFGRWKSKELEEYIESVNPEVLFFPIESYLYFNRINEYIISRFHPKKVIGYLWDDNFTYKQQPHSLMYKIERYFLRKQVKSLVSLCTDVLAICPKMKEECDREFGINSILLTKPIFNIGEYIPYHVKKPIKILYTGKLIIGREQTAVIVADAIKEINKTGQEVVLDIYTNTILPEKIRRQLDVEGCCKLHPPVPQSEVAGLQRDADVLLFLETLSEKDMTARLSFSTKLTDYFAAGKCVWAVGNKDLGPISYVDSEDSGLISTDERSVYSTLVKMVEDHNIISEYARKGYECGQRNHDGKTILGNLQKIIEV